MSANAMKPTFIDRESYLRWKAQWREVYTILAAEIVKSKRKVKLAHRQKDPNAPALQRELAQQRAMAHKMMSVLQEGKLRRDRILGMHQQLAEQNALFPMELKGCRTIDFHFNKISLEYDFMPMWTLKSQGKTFYVKHFVSQIGFETRELAEGNTRGMLRMRHGDINIDKDGIATITSAKVELSQVA